MKEATHIDEHIQDYLDGELAPDLTSRVEEHLRSCPRCAEELKACRDLSRSLRNLPGRIEPPHDLWTGIEAGIKDAGPSSVGGVASDRVFSRENSSRASESGSSGAVGHPAGGRSGARTGRRPLVRRRAAAWRRPLAVVTGIAALVLAVWSIVSLSSGSWTVERLAGTPVVADADLKERGSMRAGDWLATDGGSRARLSVGAIGDVDVEPNTRLQLRANRLNDHRIALSAGRIEARIWAPPRLFIVETPSARAIDLGCVYTLTVDSTGRSLLSVTSGYVELERDDRSSIVPAGAMCIARPEAGPGTAFAKDASRRLVEALERYDFGGGAVDDLSIILAEARPEDTITLWQIFERAPASSRARIYRRLVALETPPSGVTSEGVLAGDPEMMRTWRMHLGLEALTWSGYVWRKLAFWKD